MNSMRPFPFMAQFSNVSSEAIAPQRWLGGSCPAALQFTARNPATQAAVGCVTRPPDAQPLEGIAHAS